MLRIFVNGEPREVADGATVLDLLSELGRHPRTVAVELDGDILPRDRYAATALHDGARLEIVGFVQGGRADGRSGRGRARLRPDTHRGNPGPRSGVV